MIRRGLLTVLTWIALLPLTQSGCCPPIDPHPDRVEAWISRELPVGSSKDDVKKFCASHGFSYGAAYGDNDLKARALRRAGGCESTRPMVEIDFEYDDEQRLKATHVSGFQMLP